MPCGIVLSCICTTPSLGAACGAAEFQAATTADQFLVHANWWFVTWKEKNTTDKRAQKPAEHQETSTENHDSHSGPEKPPRILQTKRFCFFSPFTPLNAHGPLASK